MAGLFVFEGPDGVGKTTMVKEVGKQLQNAGLPSICLSFPGKEDGTLGAHVYKLHHDPLSFDVTQLSPLSLQFLHVAAHVDVIERRILPLIRQGTTVLLDRYWWSTMVYGLAAGVSKLQLEKLISMEKLAWGAIFPTTLFLLSRQQPLETLGLLDAYNDLVTQEAQSYPIVCIENASPVEVISERITSMVLNAS